MKRRWWMRERARRGGKGLAQRMLELQRRKPASAPAEEDPVNAEIRALEREEDFLP